ncbi:hypothetical protein GCM10027610_105970 [Dactylosporangium cerinum]
MALLNEQLFLVAYGRVYANDGAMTSGGRREDSRRMSLDTIRQIVHIRDYVQHSNTDAKPFTWIATAEEILAKIRWIQTSVRQLVDNNAK